MPVIYICARDSTIVDRGMEGLSEALSKGVPNLRHI
jgi:hypothetical protein